MAKLRPCNFISGLLCDFAPFASLREPAFLSINKTASTTMRRA